MSAFKSPFSETQMRESLIPFFCEDPLKTSEETISWIMQLCENLMVTVPEDSTLPFLVAEELVDCLPIRSFANTIPKLAMLLGTSHPEGISASRGRGAVMVRLWNEVHRRLSKLRDAETWGRLMISMANTFPLREKSCLNARGDMNSQLPALIEDLVQPPNMDETARFLYIVCRNIIVLMRSFALNFPKVSNNSPEIIHELLEKMAVLPTELDNGSYPYLHESDRTLCVLSTFAKLLTDRYFKAVILSIIHTCASLILAQRESIPNSAKISKLHEDSENALTLLSRTTRMCNCCPSQQPWVLHNEYCWVPFEIKDIN